MLVDALIRSVTPKDRPTVYEGNLRKMRLVSFVHLVPPSSPFGDGTSFVLTLLDNCVYLQHFLEKNCPWISINHLYRFIDVYVSLSLSHISLSYYIYMMYIKTLVVVSAWLANWWIDCFSHEFARIAALLALRDALAASAALLEEMLLHKSDVMI